jgi:hypothetical protein
MEVMKFGGKKKAAVPVFSLDFRFLFAYIRFR